MSRGAVFVAAALTSGATLAHAYTCLGAAEKRCAALRKREEELLLALEGERGKSPIRRQARTVLERELEERRLAISSLEGAREQWEAERHALGAQVEDLTQTVAREREQHERVLDEKGKELHALHARHEADIQTLHGEKLALENMLADLEKKSFAALDGLRQKLSDEQLSLERVRQALMRQEEEKVLAADAQDMLSQTLAQARKEAEKLKGDVKRLDAERARVAEELQREKDARAALELKHEQSHAERQNVEAMLERAFDERRRLASALSSMFSSLQDARLEVAASVIGAADSAQNTIRLEEQLDQERADCRDLQDQLRGMAGLRQQVEVLARERDEALAQVAEVQERDLRVIEGLMDDVAKGDVSLKQAKEEATAREDALERARDAALMDGDVLRAELEAAEQQRDALIAERDEERDAKAHALADADHVSEELMYLHGETERQVQQQTELEKKQKNAAREVNFLQEMLAKSKKRQEADAKELAEVRLEAEAWKRMASTRAPHTDARHLQWFRQSLMAKKKEGALDAVEARALAAFESESDSIFRKTTAAGQDYDARLVEAFHETILQHLSQDADTCSHVDSENAPPQSSMQTAKRPLQKAAGIFRLRAPYEL